MKVYTKTGDRGETSLVTGTRVKKFDDRIEAYGTVDELNSHLGLIYAKIMDSELKSKLLLIQNHLFVIGSQLSKDREIPIAFPDITDAEVQFLESFIDFYSSELPPLTQFILPGGDEIVSYAHICRTICRRAERLVVKLSENIEIKANLIIYLNRLSDAFFILARYFAKENKVDEIYWTWKKEE